MKVLVCVASRHGATAQIADLIAQTLRENGVQADVLPPERVAGLEGYDALVLGSAVYAGRWLRDARDLVGRVAGQLNGRPVWLFSSGPIGDQPETDPQSAVNVSAIAAATSALGHKVFGGELVRARLGSAERMIAAVMRLADQDNRDWDEIAEWGRRIAEQLKAMLSPPAAEQYVKSGSSDA